MILNLWQLGSVSRSRGGRRKLSICKGSFSYGEVKVSWTDFYDTSRTTRE